MKGFLMKFEPRRRNLILATFTLALLFPFAVDLLLNKKLEVSEKTGFAFYAYGDEAQGGNSISLLKKRKNGDLLHEYRLGNVLQYPFCGFVASRVNQDFFSTSGKLIKMSVYSDTIVRIPVGLHVYVDNFTKRSDFESFLFLEKMVILEKGMNLITVPVEEMYIPTWWFNLNNLTENEQPAYDLDQTAEITISNDQFLKPGGFRRLTFSNIRIEYDLSVIVLAAESVFALCIISLILAPYIRRPKSVPVYIPIRQQEIDENGADILNQIKYCLSENYHNPELRVKQVARETGLSENKVGVILKKSTGMTFSEYLNFVRVEEAKRLLQESTLPVSDICFRVGYEYPQNFNRVFKKTTGYTPKEFRNNTLTINGDKK